MERPHRRECQRQTVTPVDRLRSRSGRAARRPRRGPSSSAEIRKPVSAMKTVELLSCVEFCGTCATSAMETRSRVTINPSAPVASGKVTDSRLMGRAVPAQRLDPRSQLYAKENFHD
jgi:hypothetical protein